ncbi:MAG TPA: TonB-dependent receptor [Opitutus sp.]|nr:TonB-dependent receptor [Opitutus sp.]
MIPHPCNIRRSLAAGLSVAVFLIALAPIARGTEAPVGAGGSLADLSIEQLMEIPVETVFSASKYDQKITHAPASVTVVTAADIAAFRHRTLADILGSVRGFYFADDSNYTYLGARGFLRPGDYNTRLLVLVDGHRINDNVYDSAYYGHDDPVDVSVIDRVEVIRGPSSSIYGNSAFFGVVNIVTKRGRDLDGVALSADTGSFGTSEGRLNFGRRFTSGLELFLSASRYHSDGRAHIYYPEFDQRISSDPRAANDGVADHADAEDAYHLFGSATFGDFTLTAGYSRRTKVVPTASYDTLFDTDLEKTTDARGYVDLQFRRDLGAGAHLAGRAFYDSYAYRGSYPYDDATPGSPPDLVLNRDFTLGEWIGTEWQLTTTFAARQTLVTGFEFRENLHRRQLNYDETDPLTINDNDDHGGRTGAVFTQGEFTLAPGLLFNAGLRYDYYSDSFGGTLNPRLGLIYSPRERTTVKALFGRAFRAPNAYEQYYYARPAGVPLDPETIRTYELALEHYFTSHYRLGVSAYRYHIADLISQVAGGPDGYYFANLNRASANGLEFELEGHYAGGVRARASWSLQRARDDDTGTVLTNSPRQLAKLGIILPFDRERCTAAFNLRYVGAMHTIAGTTDRGYALADFTLATRRLGHGCEISASVYNLFDTRYSSPGSQEHVQPALPRPGRTLNLELTTRF